MKTDKTIYLIGNGPSLNKIDITKLKDKDTISFNRAYIAYADWGFDPTYYMCADPIVLENIKGDIQKLIDESNIKKFFLPEWSKKYFKLSDKIQYLRFIKIFNRPVKFWGKNFKYLSIISNVGATCIPVLDILGYKNIIILGTDCNYEEKKLKNVEIITNKNDKTRKIVYVSSGDNDPNHFRPDYFGKGTEYSKPQANNHYNGWLFIQSKYKKRELKILLSSPGSRLSNLFPEIDFSESLKLN